MEMKSKDSFYQMRKVFVAKEYGFCLFVGKRRACLKTELFYHLPPFFFVGGFEDERGNRCLFLNS